jgi:hypothetical protein
MKVKSLPIQILAILLFLPFCGSGQNNSYQALQKNNSYNHTTSLESLHFQQVRQGKQYQYFYPNIKGHQYRDHPIYKIGVLTFEGSSYHDILLNYDSYNHLLVTAIVQNGLTRNIILDNSRIDGFRINNQNFVNIRDSTSLLTPGFYILVFQGTGVQYFTQTQKSVVGNTGRPGEPLKKFVAEESHILLVNGEMHIVKNKKDVIEAFIRSSKLRFKKNNEMTSSLLVILGEL